jgi:ribonuclease P protein component
VFDGRLRRAAGPLLVYARANGLSHTRLGLSVSRRVGGSVKRSNVKRLLREAFRLSQHELPPGLDVVIVVRPHELLPLDRYCSALLEVTGSLARAVARGREGSGSATPHSGQHPAPAPEEMS